MLLLRTVLSGPQEYLLAKASKIAAAFPLPGAKLGISINLPWSWFGLLQAVPKKRTSHRKKRQRQLAGNNQQQPLRNLNRCPACGHYKRAHTLCMHCVEDVRKIWRKQDREALEAKHDPSKSYDPSKLSSEDTTFNYPKPLSRPSEYQEKLADLGSYLLKRPRTLEVKPKKPKEKKLPLLLRRPYS